MGIHFSTLKSILDSLILKAKKTQRKPTLVISGTNRAVYRFTIYIEHRYPRIDRYIEPNIVVLVKIDNFLQYCKTACTWIKDSNREPLSLLAIITKIDVVETAFIINNRFDYIGRCLSRLLICLFGGVHPMISAKNTANSMVFFMSIFYLLIYITRSTVMTIVA